VIHPNSNYRGCKATNNFQELINDLLILNIKIIENIPVVFDSIEDK